MREQVVDVPPQEVITSDNVVVSVDAVIYYEATDAATAGVYNVANFQLAVTKLAQTNLRNVVGDMQLDDALTSRDTINAQLRDILDDATDKWGTRVVRVEIQRIDPPPDVVESMHQQMQAERTRRAVVTEAQGMREACDHARRGREAGRDPRSRRCAQSGILEAQGQAEAIERLADAERDTARSRWPRARPQAIRSVYDAIHDGDPTPDLLAREVPRGAGAGGRRPGDEDLPPDRDERALRRGRRSRRAPPRAASRRPSRRRPWTARPRPGTGRRGLCLLVRGLRHRALLDHQAQVVRARRRGERLAQLDRRPRRRGSSRLWSKVCMP